MLNKWTVKSLHDDGLSLHRVLSKIVFHPMCRKTGMKMKKKIIIKVLFIYLYTMVKYNIRAFSNKIIYNCHII